MPLLIGEEERGRKSVTVRDSVTTRDKIFVPEKDMGVSLDPDFCPKETVASLPTATGGCPAKRYNVQREGHRRPVLRKTPVGPW